MKSQRRKFLLAAVLFTLSVLGAQAQSVQYTDTAAMLSGYARSGQYVKYSDTADMMNNLLRKSDTAAMLRRYLLKVDSASFITTGSITGYAVNTTQFTSSGFHEYKAMPNPAATLPALSSLSSGFFVDSLGKRITYSEANYASSIFTSRTVPRMTLWRYNGTFNNRTAVLKDNNLGTYGFGGESADGSGAFQQQAYMMGASLDDYTSTTRGTRLHFFTTSAGTTTVAPRFLMDEFAFSPIVDNNKYSIGKSSLRFSKGYFADTVFGSHFVRAGGTSSQFLKADGSVDSTTYLSLADTAALFAGMGHTENLVKYSDTGVSANLSTPHFIRNDYTNKQTGGINIDTARITNMEVTSRLKSQSISATNLSSYVFSYPRLTTAEAAAMTPAPSKGPLQTYYDSLGRIINLSPAGGVGAIVMNYAVLGSSNTTYRYSGTWAAKTPVNAGFTISGWSAAGWDGSAWGTVAGINMGVGPNALSTTNHGGRISFTTTATNSTATTTKITFDENGAILKGTTTSPANPNLKDYTIGSVFATDTSYAKAFVKAGGLSTQFLKADGSVDGNTYLTNAIPYLPLAGGQLTGTLDGYNANFNGIVRTKKVTVTPNGWTDYVFEKDYKLRSLDEVANFIKANKHLPDVPSAKEVAENGISVGENQAALLRKIEELTLYVIDLKREINEMKKERVTKIKAQRGTSK